MGTERYHPVVAVDLRAACQHYDGIAIDLGNRFRANVEAKSQAIVERPESFGRIGGDFRGALIDRFPYVVVFAVEDGIPCIDGVDTPHLTKIAGLIESFLKRADNNALDAEPRIASFLKSTLVGGGPVNAAVELSRVCFHNRESVRFSPAPPTTPLCLGQASN